MHIPHYIFEEYVKEHELFFVGVVDNFGKVDFDRVLHLLQRALAFDLIGDHLMAENIFLEGDVKGEFLLKLLPASFEYRPHSFTGIIRDLRLEFDAILHDITILVLYVHAVKVGD